MAPVKPVSEPVAPAPAPSGEHIAASWLSDVSRQTGIGTVALEAYALASVRLAREQPKCHVGWTTLAGIGAIESGHGTNGGSRLRADGTTSRPILGPALDGSSGMARIPSTSSPRSGTATRDGTTPSDPCSSSRRRGASGAPTATTTARPTPTTSSTRPTAAGRYLCASGRDMRTGEGWTQAIFSYNHSEDYVRSVVARANSYVKH